MKDEIKEKIKAYYIGNDIDKLLDYITNLQEELRIRDTNWQSLKYYLEKLYNKDYIEEEIFDDICKRVNELESQIEIKSYQKEITNLQEENERLKVNCNIGNENLTFYRNSYKDYKTRNEKAIEYIEKGNKHFKENYNEPYEYAFMVNADEIMKILKGE